MANYFKIIDEANFQILELIDKYVISPSQYFPIYGFSKINKKIKCEEKLKKQQKEKIENIKNKANSICKVGYTSIEEINKNEKITKSNKIDTVICSILNESVDLENARKFIENFKEKTSTDYRKLLCVYDYIKYKN